MIRKLKVDPQLKELATTPLHIALLCLVSWSVSFQENRDTIVECALRRDFVKLGISLNDNNPTERCKEELYQMGKLAFEALQKDQLYFSEDEMKCQSTDFVKLPFLSRTQSVRKSKATKCYAFTHKSFQEYFTALYSTSQLLSGDKGSKTLLDQPSPAGKYVWEWDFLFTMIPRKSGEKEWFCVFVMPSKTKFPKPA